MDPVDKQCQHHQQRQHTGDGIEKSVGARNVTHPGVRRPVVRVGVIFARAQRCGHPCRPEEKACHLQSLFLLTDGVGQKSIARFTVLKGFSPVGNHALQALDLRIGQRERIAVGIITVGFELSFGFNIDDVFLQVIKLIVGFAVLCHGQIIADRLGNDVQGRSGKLRPSLGAVSPDGPVIHQAVALIDVLAGQNIRAFKKQLAGGIDDFSWIRRQIFLHDNAAAQQNGHGDDKTKNCCPF